MLGGSHCGCVLVGQTCAVSPGGVLALCLLRYYYTYSTQVHRGRGSLALYVINQLFVQQHIYPFI